MVLAAPSHSLRPRRPTCQSLQALSEYHKSAAEKPAGAAVPASGPAPSTASIAPPPRSSATPVDAPAAADAPPVGQIRQQVDAPAAADAPAAEQSHEPVQARAAVDGGGHASREQSHEKADVTTPADAPEVSEHTAAPNVSSPSESSAYCDAPAADQSLSAGQSIPPPPPSRQRPPLSPRRRSPCARGHDFGGPNLLRPLTGRNRPSKPSTRSRRRLAVNPSQASGSAPSPGISSSPSTESAAEKTSTPGHVIGDGIWLGSPIRGQQQSRRACSMLPKTRSWCLCPPRSPHQSSCRPCHKP